MPSGLSSQKLWVNLCTWAHNVRLHIAVTKEKATRVAEKAIVVTTGRTYCFYDYIYIYFPHRPSVRFQHLSYRSSLMTTNIALLAWLVEHSLVCGYQQCVTVLHVNKYISSHEVTVLTTGRWHPFHD